MRSRSCPMRDGRAPRRPGELGVRAKVRRHVRAGVAAPEIRSNPQIRLPHLRVPSYLPRRPFGPHLPIVQYIRIIAHCQRHVDILARPAASTSLARDRQPIQRAQTQRAKRFASAWHVISVDWTSQVQAWRLSRLDRHRRRHVPAEAGVDLIRRNDDHVGHVALLVLAERLDPTHFRSSGR